MYLEHSHAVMATDSLIQLHADFSVQLFHIIGNENIEKNLVFSPSSIQFCLALPFCAAAGHTAKELQEGLGLSGDKELIADKFGSLMSLTRKTTSITFKMANRIYVSHHLQIEPEFNEVAGKYFETVAENVNFADRGKAAELINNWVKQQTNQKIEQLIDAEGLRDSFHIVLINAIYFNAEWEHKFRKNDTIKGQFYMDANRHVTVDMMFQAGKFKYKELCYLDAVALELPYKDTDITMLILLPNEIEGLGLLEKQSKNVDLLQISSELKTEHVYVHFPKFNIEFDISLPSVLKRLGIRTAFTQEAEFSSLIANESVALLSEIKHKSIIEVNEMGIGAKDATLPNVKAKTGTLNEKFYDIIVDHPFIFAIRDSKLIYLLGHVVNL